MYDNRGLTIYTHDFANANSITLQRRVLATLKIRIICHNMSSFLQITAMFSNQRPIFYDGDPKMHLPVQITDPYVQSIRNCTLIMALPPIAEVCHLTETAFDTKAL